MAEKICELNLEKFPGDANLLALSARANIALRRFELARSRIEEAIHLFPDFPAAHETYGDLLVLQGRPGDALESYQQAMRLDPTRALVHDKIDRARELEQQAKSSPQQETKARMSNAEEMAIAQEYEKNDDRICGDDLSGYSQEEPGPRGGGTTTCSDRVVPAIP